MKYKRSIIFCVLLSGCASAPQSIIRMPTGSDTAVVTLGYDDAKVGDRLEVLQTECRSIPKKDFESVKCSHVSAGFAQIIELKEGRDAVIKSVNRAPLVEGFLLKRVSDKTE